MKKHRYKILFLFVLTNSCKEQNNIGQNTQVNRDSITKTTLTKQDSILQEFISLNSNTKDSIWINKLKGITVWDSRRKLFYRRPCLIIDSLTKNFYILDSSHSSITAYKSMKNVMWEINPYKKGGVNNYRHKNPTIWHLNIEPKNRDGSGERVLHVSYTNSQFGYIDLKSGEFHYQGQD